jgi:hypothetical protein
MDVFDGERISEESKKSAVTNQQRVSPYPWASCLLLSVLLFVCFSEQKLRLVNPTMCPDPEAGTGARLLSLWLYGWLKRLHAVDNRSTTYILNVYRCFVRWSWLDFYSLILPLPLVEGQRKLLSSIMSGHGCFVMWGWCRTFSSLLLTPPPQMSICYPSSITSYWA